MSILASKPVHTISVRDLVAFVLRAGDLGGEREFVGSDRALAGIRGHQKIQNSRPTGYLTELPVEYRVETDEFTLHIRGALTVCSSPPIKCCWKKSKPCREHGTTKPIRFIGHRQGFTPSSMPRKTA